VQVAPATVAVYVSLHYALSTGLLLYKLRRSGGRRVGCDEMYSRELFKPASYIYQERHFRDLAGGHWVQMGLPPAAR